MTARRWLVALCAMNVACASSARRPIERAGNLKVADEAEPRNAFEDSRRLTGANRSCGGPAVVLVPLGPAAMDGATHGRWVAQVVSMCSALGWPAPMPRVHQGAASVSLAFAAPPAALFTATEVNEWAWERAAAEHAGHAQAGFALAQPATEAAAAHFQRRAAAERSRPLELLRESAQRRDLPWLEDDDTVSIGEGAFCRVWPRAAVPLPMDVPWPALHAVPKILVSGSNGKTTTTRLLAAMAARAGFMPGLCSTEGVQVGSRTVATGDYAGPAGARAVLRHPQVTAAVLETARGGLLRRGLAVQRADVAVITNVSADHLGEYGIETVEDVAEIKLVLAHAVARGGTLVLNGGDRTLLRVAAQLPHAQVARWAVFGREHDTPILQTVRDHQGSTCGAHEGRLLLSHLGHRHELGAVADMPLSLGGTAGFNVENLAAAALAAALMGWPLQAVQEVLHAFGREPQNNPGRLQRFTHRGATVLLDYAHNPDGLAQLLSVALALRPPQGPSRLGLLLGQAGNRDDEAIAELARTAAAFRPDRVLLKELPQMLRGRAPGSVPAQLEAALLDAGQVAASVSHQHDEEAAARELLAWAEPGDVLVLPLHTAEVRERILQLLAGAP
jgi:UDP-N-acetylmuramyl tripeptide synthase